MCEYKIKALKIKIRTSATIIGNTLYFFLNAIHTINHANATKKDGIDVINPKLAIGETKKDQS